MNAGGGRGVPDDAPLLEDLGLCLSEGPTRTEVRPLVEFTTRTIGAWTRGRFGRRIWARHGTGVLEAVARPRRLAEARVLRVRW